MSSSANSVVLRSHKEGFEEKGEEYWEAGEYMEVRNFTDGNGKKSVNVLLCGTI